MASEKQIVTEAANRYGIRPDILWGLYGTETSFGKDLSTSSAGAEGPFQFEPGTARSLGINPHDFKSAAFGAAKYLAEFKGRGTAGMLSAYNAGPAGGLQQGYVDKTLANAKTFGKEPNLSIAPKAPTAAPTAKGPSTLATPPAFNSEAFQKANRAAQGSATVAGLFSGKTAGDQALRQALTLPRPQTSQFMTPGAAPARPSSPNNISVRSPNTGQSELGGFIPKGQGAKLERIDQGQDLKTKAGGPLIAPGNFKVIAIKSDPSGFGPNYPVVQFTSGHLAGKTLYFGHTHTAHPVGYVGKAGEAISHTGYGTNEGNAKVPGWAEVGESSALGSGNMQAGRAVAPYFH